MGSEPHVSARTTSWNLGYLAEEHVGAEHARLEADARREKNWKRWGPYLSERQWGTVREDYSPDGDVLGATSRTTTRAAAPTAGARTACSASAIAQCRLCFALALWNEQRPDPQGAPVRAHRPRGQPRRGRQGALLLPRRHADALVPEGALQVSAGGVPVRAARRREPPARQGTSPSSSSLDTGVFDDGRYFDVFVEYAKAAPDDVLIRVTVANRGPEAAPLHLLPTLWFRNTWTWGRSGEGYGAEARDRSRGDRARRPSTRRMTAAAARRRRRAATATAASCCSRRTRRTPQRLFGVAERDART